MKIYLPLLLFLSLNSIEILSAQEAAVNVGDTSILHLQITGTSSTIQWQESTDSIVWLNITNATDSVCTLIVTESPTNKRFYRANVIVANCANTAWYSKVITHKITPKTVTDIDGNIYNTVIIGKQAWLKENLRTTKFNNGVAIPIVTNASTWTSLNTVAYCNYNNTANLDTIQTNGRLYNWFSANNSKLCPTGWQVPTDSDWVILSLTLDTNTKLESSPISLIAGGKLKEADTIHWLSKNEGATNESGFTAIPSGFRDGFFTYMGTYAWYWCKNEKISINYGWSIQLMNFASVLLKQDRQKTSGLSIRCILNSKPIKNIYSTINIIPLTITLADKSINCGSNATLTSTTNYTSTDSLKYVWSPATGLNNTLIAEPVVNIISNSTYTVTVTTPNGCSASDNMDITVTPMPFTQKPQLCIITTDIKTGKNLIIWNKEEYTGGCIKIAGYYMLRQRSFSKWDTLSFVPFNTTNSYVDTSSTPELKAYNYKIITKDTLGRLSPESDIHTPLLLQYGGLTGDVLALNWTTYKINNTDYTFDNYILYGSDRKDTLIVIDDQILYDKTSINVKTNLTKKIYYRIGGAMIDGCYSDSIFISNPQKKGVTPGKIKQSTSNLEDNKIDGPISVKEITQNSFSVFPNPSNDKLFINLEEYLPNTFIVVTDISGKTITTQQAYLYNTIDINSFENGVYLIKLVNSNGAVVKMFLKM